MIRVAIVEDEELFKEQLNKAVNATDDLICATFEDAESFGADFRFECDVVLMDIQLPGKSKFKIFWSRSTVKPHVQFLII